MFFWSCFALASGPLLFPSIFTDLLNPVMVTSLPILLYPMFDTDVTKVESLCTPTLYTAGIARIHYTRRRLLMWVAEGVYAAALCAYLPVFFAHGSEDGTLSVAEMSLAAMWSVCAVIDARLVLENHSWTALDKFGVVAMLLVLVLCSAIFSFVNNDDPGSFGWGSLYGTAPQLFVRPSFWLVLALCVVLSLAPRLVFLAWQCVFRGSKLQHLAQHASSRLTVSSMRQSQAASFARLPGVANLEMSEKGAITPARRQPSSATLVEQVSEV